MGIASFVESGEPNSYVITGTETLPVITTHTDAIRFQINGFSSCAENAFHQCSRLINISFDNSLKSLPNNIFGGTLIEYFTLPASVTALDYLQSFDYASNLKYIKVEQNNPSYADVNGIVYTKDLKKLYYWPPNRNETLIIVPNGVEVIGRAAFSCNNNITYLRLPPSVKKIEPSFLYNCQNIRLVEIQNYEKKVIQEKFQWFAGSLQEVEVLFIPILPLRCPSEDFCPYYYEHLLADAFFIFMM